MIEPTRTEDMMVDTPALMILQTTEVMMEERAKRPPEKIMMMPPPSPLTQGFPPPPSPGLDSSQVMDISTTHDSRRPKKVAPPVAAKPHSVYSEVKNSITIPRPDYSPVNGDSSYLENGVRHSSSTESTDAAADDMEFPPPPDSEEILTAIDRINAKYDSSVNIMAALAKNDHVGTSEELPVGVLAPPDPVETRQNDVSANREVAALPPWEKSSRPNSQESSSDALSEPRCLAIADRKLMLEGLLGERLDASVSISTEEMKSPSLLSPLSELSNDSAISTCSDFGTSVDNNSHDSHVQYEVSAGSENGTENGTALTSEALTSFTPQEHQLKAMSESGDSGMYSLIGETVEVKLRSTKIGNRKSDYAVPMFEKSPAEIRRVTFQVKDAQHEILAATVLRSPKEEERIARTGVSEDDVAQIEMFYRGHKSEVMVCPCLATLYFAEGVSGETVSVNDWTPAHIGVPLIVYDTGNGKRPRGLTLIFAEKGTGFSLWKTAINWESRFEVVEQVFHRLKVAARRDQLAGIAYQDGQSADALYKFYKDSTSDPELNVLNNPHIKIKKRKDKGSKRQKPPKLPLKQAISLPCQFTHITQLKQSEEGILAQAMVPVEDGSVSSEDGTRLSK